MPTSRPGIPNPEAFRNWGDIALATVLALCPLLPSGPRYLGLGDGNYSLIGFTAIVLVWAIVRVNEPSARPASSCGSGVMWAWGAFMVVGTGAAAVAVRVENDVTSPVFWAHVRQLPTDLARPMDMLSHPLYAVSVWVVLLQGAVAFAVVRDLCLRAPDPVRRARVALNGWLSGWAAVALFAAIQYVTRFQLHPYWVAVNPALARSHATFEDPNALGAYLALGLGLIVAPMYFSGATGNKRRRGRAALVLLGCIGVATTMSRSAWIGLGVTIALGVGFGPAAWLSVSARQSRLRRTAQVLLIGAALVGSASLIARALIGPEPIPYEPTNPLQVIAGTLDPRVPLASAFSGRLGWWGAAFSMFDGQPIVGVGLGQYPRLVTEYAASGVVAENAHSFPLQVLAETGGLGFITLGFLVVAVFGALLGASIGRDSEGATIARGGLIGIAAFSVTCLSSHPLLLASGQLALATMLAPVLVAAGGGGGAAATASTPTIDPTGQAPIWVRMPRALALLAILWYSAAALRSTPPPWETAPWGYSWGLFPEETDGTQSFRWTGQRAIVELDTPEAATGVTVEIAAPSPMRGGRATEARVMIGDRVTPLTLSTATRVRIRSPLPNDAQDRSPLRLSIEVDSALIPADQGGSADTRELGVQLFPPTFDKN